MRLHLLCFTAFVMPSVAMSSTVEVAGEQYTLEAPSCTLGEGYYLIDTKGDGVSLSVVTDKTYTAFDFFFVSGGEDLRAGASVEPIALQDGGFTFAGEVPVSNGTRAEIRIALDACS